MRFRHPDGSTIHLAYCSNVHPGEDADGIVAQLRRFALPVRARLGVPALGVGLWVPAAAARELAGDWQALGRLRSELEACRLEVVTMNGFPYRGFHEPVVKHAVYRPDWADPARAAYTLDLARLLGSLLPESAEEGSISTLPLGWRVGWSAEKDVAARRALERLGEQLGKLAAETGRPVRVGLEPEPGCAAETVAGLAAWLADVDPEWIGVCLDACHLAVQFEDPVEALALLAKAGVPVIKAQLSSGLRKEPGADAGRLREFVEPRFLHQVRTRAEKGVRGVEDLGHALAGGLPEEAEWRVHFHVPLQVPGPETTQAELDATLAALVGGPAARTRHLEVETYTWSVLPPGRRPSDDHGLVEGLSLELAWVRERLSRLGLEELRA